MFLFGLTFGGTAPSTPGVTNRHLHQFLASSLAIFVLIECYYICTRGRQVTHRAGTSLRSCVQLAVFMVNLEPAPRHSADRMRILSPTILHSRYSLRILSSLYAVAPVSRLNVHRHHRPVGACTSRKPADTSTASGSACSSWSSASAS